MSEYTPSTEQVREAAYEHGSTGVTYEEFDRWIAAHDAKVRVEALRKAAEGLMSGFWPKDDEPGVKNAAREIHYRADCIEREVSS